ncbi:bifunctional alpha/beta hydrolase/OsmC family protein [Corynebacterium pseudotuberculosis]|uniref:Alpha/beta fold hydrolase n=1 Tax=Corynebacterium pseudotuberculosis (strain C231) TaxID=681645 RepID=D9QA95_CORP2|nr:alpha/beta fold hydrolase [Corynebacterium pseudotuberculosis]ADK28792.1 alpha/beta fold hydrolase [Corynebacterium pseudotuberculosis FRC41]ADL10471.1 alpha/beta fold hydrolase [Corynebacterium pseudotuberculosis C231]ADL20878.1 alpha/beta hydrolase [Corynebacterium pseudotuberculosis 1002]ADO26267.1 alpha/beta fold hydrolase [Corynebacterium pseudotuberculosis I19]AEK92327.1 Hydrolase alpha/beta superfamily [Corynebacterium pseudotuberculosis PAT10]
MHSVSVKVPSSKGYQMAGTIDFPDAPPAAFALFAHCFTGSRFTPAAARVSKTLADLGIACLRFDFPGLGQSEGNFAETCFSENVEDIRAAAQWLKDNYTAPQLLIGHSLGGAASLKAATDMPSIKAVATIGAPFDPAHAVLHFANRISEVDETGAVTLLLGGRDITISREFLEDLAETNPEAYLPRLRKPLLILHSPTDTTVGVDNAQLIFRTTRYPKSLVALHKVDHLVTKQGAAQQAARIIRTWAAQHLTTENTPENAYKIPESAAIARSIPAGTFTDHVQTGMHSFTTDREKSQGGKNLGYTPMALIASALAAASSQAIRSVAKEKRISSLKNVNVTVEKILTANDDAQLHRKIELIGELSGEERTILLAAAKKNEVEALLSKDIVIDTSSV